MEYDVAPWKLIHPAFMVLAGAGSADLRDRVSGSSAEPSQFFYVIEPQAQMVANFAPAVRAGIDVSYRAVLATHDDVALSGNHLGGLAVGMFLQAGWF